MLFRVLPFVLQMCKPFYNNPLFQRSFWCKDLEHVKTHNKSTLILSKELISVTKKWKIDRKYLPKLEKKKKKSLSARALSSVRFALIHQMVPLKTVLIFMPQFHGKKVTSLFKFQILWLQDSLDLMRSEMSLGLGPPSCSLYFTSTAV